MAEITIPRAEYDSLVQKAEKLYILRNYIVDNATFKYTSYEDLREPDDIMVLIKALFPEDYESRVEILKAEREES